MESPTRLVGALRAGQPSNRQSPRRCGCVANGVRGLTTPCSRRRGRYPLHEHGGAVAQAARYPAINADLFIDFLETQSPLGDKGGPMSLRVAYAITGCRMPKPV